MMRRVSFGQTPKLTAQSDPGHQTITGSLKEETLEPIQIEHRELPFLYV